jgi:hypothetical protein
MAVAALGRMMAAAALAGACRQADNSASEDWWFLIAPQGHVQHLVVIAGLDPAIHLLRKKSLRRMDGPPNSGLHEFGFLSCASRINPTCVVKPAGDACRVGTGRSSSRHDLRRGRPLTGHGHSLESSRLLAGGERQQQRAQKQQLY